jgi:hypothetical protein
MASVTGKIIQQVNFSLPAAGTPIAYAIPAKMPALTREYTTGTGANQADGLHYKSYSLASTATTLDLTAMTDPNGAAITCTTGRIREFVLQNTSGFPLILGNAAATQWLGMISTTTGTLTVPPGGIHHFSDPTTVGSSAGAYVDATHKSLKIDAGAHTVTFNLIIAFCSAQS